MSLRTMHLQDLNPHIMCVLCGGYLVDATTIVECLHSFCRSCIVKYLQTSYHCPVCDVEVHKTKPLLHIRPDRTLQDIVYKIVPGIYHEEVNRRKDFEVSQKEKNEPATEEAAANDDTAPKDKDKDALPFDDPVCITLEYFRKTRNRMEKDVFPTRYLRCSSEVTVKVLKKFVVMKFAIPETHITEIIRSDEILDGHLTMKEVCRIYGLYSKPFVDLQYVFLEKNETTACVEKPKILDVKRKRIKKRKGNKSLLKKCLGLNITPRQFKNKGGKKKNLSSSQPEPSENVKKVDVEPIPPQPIENDKGENLVLSPIPPCVNVNKEELVSSQELSVGDKVENSMENNIIEPSLPVEPYCNGEEISDSLLQPSMDNQNGRNVNENETLAIGKSDVMGFNQLALVEALVNGIDTSSSTSTPSSIPDPARLWSTVNVGSGDETAVKTTLNDLKHAQPDESYRTKELDTSVSHCTNDVCMNHISTDLESSPMLHGLGLLLESL